jgi:cytochrome P450
VQRIKPLFGEGLTTSEGARWHHQRRLIQPLFTHQRLVALAAVVIEVTTAMLKRWQPMAEQGKPLDMAAEMLALTQTIILRILFGADGMQEISQLSQALTTVFDHLSQRVWTVVTALDYLPTAHHRHFRQALHTLNTFVYGLIAARHHREKETDDLLSLLLQARDEETGAPMSDTQLRDEVMTLCIAGYTTTATALTWTWYLLSQHSTAERTLQQELATVLRGHPPTVQDLSALPYTHMLIAEGLRLYPPTWITARTPLADEEIGGYRLPAKSVLLLSPYVTHRHPGFWENPTHFSPERFTPGRAMPRPPFAYFPFGGGPRFCIGQSFALMEMSLIVAMIAQTYHLRLVPGHPVAPQPLVTLRPRHGMLMTLHPHREKSG